MDLNAYPIELLRIRKLWIFTPLVQMAVVAVLYVATTLLFARGFRISGSMGGYPPEVWILFVPITEEILFRGFILGALEKAYGAVWAVVLSSALFGIWHLKNTFWMANDDLEGQMAYCAFIFGPVMAIITLKTRSVWPGVVLHYLNNFPVDLLPPPFGVK